MMSVRGERAFRVRLGHAMAVASLIMSGVSVVLFVVLAEYRSIAAGITEARAPLMMTSLILGVGALPVAVGATLAARGKASSISLVIACVHLALHVMVT
jgi:hypothetical protein